MTSFKVGVMEVSPTVGWSLGTPTASCPYCGYVPVVFPVYLVNPGTALAVTGLELGLGLGLGLVLGLGGHLGSYWDRAIQNDERG